MQERRDLFWKLIEPEYFGVMRFCRKLMSNRDRGDDLFQDTLLAAFTGFDSLRQPTSIRPWLYRIAVNTFNSKVRRRWWRRFVPLTPEVAWQTGGDDPIETLAARRWLGRAFQALTPEQQVLVTLHELEDWPINELAALMGHSEGAIKARLFRARRKMKKLLLPYYGKRGSSKTKETLLNEADKCVAAKPESE